MKYFTLIMAFLTVFSGPALFAQEEVFPEDEMAEYEESTTEYVSPEEAQENFQREEDAPLSDEEWSYNTDEPLPEDY